MSFQDTPTFKLKELERILLSMQRIVVAFSGGVDSTFLLYAAHKWLESNAIAVTIATPYIPKWEINEATAFTKEFGIRHSIIELDFPPFLRDNPEDRCYQCKSFLFQKLRQFAEDENAILTDGTNHDDTGDYRPGLRALTELKVRSPLLEAKLGKNDIRELSRDWGLSTWDKPAYACLMTRVPFGTTISDGELRQIEQAETALMELGFRAVRVRHHGNLARIELPQQEIIKATEMRREITACLQQAGYRFVTIDLNGYAMGSFNPTPKSPHNSQNHTVRIQELELV